MNISELKRESKEFAFNNKMLIWKPMLILLGLSMVALAIASVGYAINDFLGSLLDMAASIFVWIVTPVITAGTYLMLKSYFKGTNKSFEESIEPIKPKWSNFFTTYVMVSLFTALWSFLFVIPGIVKSYAYSQALYIQAENPDMNWKECIQKSQDMMYGHKMELFKVHLSMIGWILLVSFTLGIAAIWVVPYLTTISTKYYMYLNNDQECITVDANVVIEHVVTCPFCGQETNEDSKFCPKCGSAIK